MPRHIFLIFHECLIKLIHYGSMINCVSWKIVSISPWLFWLTADALTSWRGEAWLLLCKKSCRFHLDCFDWQLMWRWWTASARRSSSGKLVELAWLIRSRLTKLTGPENNISMVPGHFLFMHALAKRASQARFARLWALIMQAHLSDFW